MTLQVFKYLNMWENISVCPLVFKPSTRQRRVVELQIVYDFTSVKIFKYVRENISACPLVFKESTRLRRGIELRIVYDFTSVKTFEYVVKHTRGVQYVRKTH